jgi:phage tail-like protein
MARPFEVVRTADQWLRASHDRTALDDTTGIVSLGWTDPPATTGGEPLRATGLAFDAECRLYRVADGGVERILWAAPPPHDVEPLDLLAPAVGGAGGDFASDPHRPPLRRPGGLAVDEDDRLFVAETGARRVLVFDLWSRRLLRAVRVAGLPLDLASRGRTVWALLDDAPAVVRLESRTGPHDPSPIACDEPLRIAVGASGLPVVLVRRGTNRWIVPLDAPQFAFVVDGAGDIEFDGDGSLVVGRGPEADLLRFRIDAEGVFEETPLRARGYDGLGLARDPNGRVGYWTARGFREGTPARVHFVPRGRVYTYRLDAGAFQTEWGRVFVDACIPGGCDLRVHAATADEPGDEQTILRAPPVNTTNAVVPQPQLSPPLVPVSLAPAPDEVGLPLHRRETGRELPWARPAAGDPFITYEAPIAAPPGRYLWLAFDLTGTAHVSPRIKCVRAEHPSHDLLRRLPRTFSREAEPADFLRRYLAIFEGALGDLDDRGAERRVLVDPASAPAEILPWLAGFLGLVLDEDWDEQTRRTVIARAVQLFRFRGTPCGLREFLELVTGAPVLVLEHYRFRGLGGAIVGDDPTQPFAGAIVGSTLRVGGEVGVPGSRPLAGTTADAFAATAHRFTVLVGAELSDVQRRIVEYVLRVHRPAHTVYDVCTVGSGIRVGRGLHVGMFATIGRTGGFATLQVGETAIGRAAIVGRPVDGARLGETQLDTDARVG